MSAWLANVIALGMLFTITLVWALALLWRVGSWHIPNSASLTFDEGLRIGARAPEIAAHTTDGHDRHLSFGGRTSFVVFGASGCKPCESLLRVAPTHPATASMRRIYVTDRQGGALDPDHLAAWEVFEFHDERGVRDAWRAPVSPYFHVIDVDGRILEKGVADKEGHLDRLLSLKPVALRAHSHGAAQPAVLPVQHSDQGKMDEF